MSFQGSSSTTTTTTTGSVTVEILGQRMSLKSDKDPSHVQELARHINDKARMIQSAAPNAAKDRIMMMVSMMVAEELYEARREVDMLKSSVSERVDAALAKLDDLDGPARS